MLCGLQGVVKCIQQLLPKPHLTDTCRNLLLTNEALPSSAEEMRRTRQSRGWKVAPLPLDYLSVG